MGLFSARSRASACVASAAALAVLVAPGVASAKTVSNQCTGSNIIAAGSTLQKLAQKEVWEPDFNTSKNAKACSGTLKPTVSYESIGSGAGLEKWGAFGHTFEMGRVGIVATDEPVNEAEKAEIEKNETTSVANSVQTVPVLQGAVALIVNLPANCTATSTAYPGRLVLNNVTLEGIWRGSIKNWSEIKDDGDTISGSGCNPATAITRVVRLDGSGTTHVFKKYLNLINTATFETEKAETKTWDEISEGTENTTWPAAAAVVRPSATGGGALVSKVASTPGSIGYANLADARANGEFSKTGKGGKETGKFWTPVQNNGTSTKKPTYTDPSTDGDTEPLAQANCAKTKYTNGKGTKFPPASTADSWAAVTTETKEKAYPICGLTYDMVVSKYSAYPGTTEGEELTAVNFLNFVLETKAEGGQQLIEDHDYEAIPSKLSKEGVNGLKTVSF
jgi:ABC-type phosphate transport system substrate-binding protein